MLLHFCHLPSVLVDGVDQRPDDIDAVFVSGYFGAQLCVEVEEEGVCVVLIEQEVFHHQESDYYVRFGPL